MMNCKSILIGGGGLYLCSLSLSLADEFHLKDSKVSKEVSQSGISVYDLGRIEIQNASSASDNTTINTITSSDIANSSSNDVASALRYTSGVFFRPAGYDSTAMRGEPSLAIRGFSSGNVGFFIDGIPVSAFYGRTDWGQFNTFGISEITISKGYTSPIYGMNTLGGAVNIITSKPKDKLEINARYGFVSSNENQASLSIGSNLGQYYIQASYAYTDRDSYNLSHHFIPTSLQPKGEKINSYYTNHTFRGKIGWQPNENHEYSLNMIYQRGEKGGLLNANSASNWWEWPHYDKTTIYLLGNSQVTDKFSINTRLYYDAFYNVLNAFGRQNSPSQGFVGKSIYDDYRLGGILTLGYDFTKDINLTGGLNLMHQRHRSSGNTRGMPDPDKDLQEISTSIFAQYSQRINDIFRFMVSGSYDRNDMTKATLDVINNQQGDKPSMQGWTLQGIMYANINDYLNTHFNIGKKSYLPDLSSRYSENMGGTISNPSLMPESAINYELGASFEYENTNASMAIFFNDFTDMITMIQVQSGGSFGSCASPRNGMCNRTINVDTGYAYGVELALKQGFLQDKIIFGANYTYTQKKATKNSGDFGLDGRILNYPNHIFNANFVLNPWKPLDIIANMTFQSKQYSISNSIYTQNNDIFLLDLKLNYRVINPLTLSLGAYNVLDRNYYYTQGYYMPGRRIFTSIEYQF